MMIKVKHLFAVLLLMTLLIGCVGVVAFTALSRVTWLTTQVATLAEDTVKIADILELQGHNSQLTSETMDMQMNNLRMIAETLKLMREQ